MTELANPGEQAAWIARNRTTWNERADSWDRLHADREEENAAQLGRALAALNGAPGSRFLDVGCGPGYWAVGFAVGGARVTAIDLASAMLAFAARRADSAGVALELREGDVLAQLAHDADATYDAVHCRCMLQFTPDPAAVLREFKRVLKPAGRLLVAVPGALSPIYSESYHRFLEPMTNNRILPWELDRLLDALGWEVVDGWGTFAEAGAGQPNAFNEPAILTLPRRLQQAAATIWSTIASPR
jgi:SAM-dependent methyltransferase